MAKDSAISPAPRPLTEPEKRLVRWLLRKDETLTEVPLIDVDDCFVRRYNESECLLFVCPMHDDTVGGTGQKAYFDDVDKVGCTAFLVYDSRRRIRELDLWKGDDSPLLQIPPDFP